MIGCDLGGRGCREWVLARLVALHRQGSTKVKLPQPFKLTIPPLCVPINTFYIHIFIRPYYEVAPVLVHTIQLTLHLVVIVVLVF